MYRVELKGGVPEGYRPCVGSVPNVPCGVERIGSIVPFPVIGRVPNVPCGVESRKVCWACCAGFFMFLMYRVELKAKP